MPDMRLVEFVHFQNGVAIGAWIAGINADFVMGVVPLDIAEEIAAVVGMRWQQHMAGRFNHSKNSWSNMLVRGDEYNPRNVEQRYYYNQWTLEQAEKAREAAPNTEIRTDSPFWKWGSDT